MPAIAQQSTQTNQKVPINNTATYSYTDDSPKPTRYQGFSSKLNVKPSLVDPLGRILGCAGKLLPDYTGFSTAVYELNPGDMTGTELGNLVNLTRTDNINGNNIPDGLFPNIENINPYFLDDKNEKRGVYNFLLDPNKGQLIPGKTYILVVNPPANSVFQQRRIQIKILQPIGNVGAVNNVIRYIATSLDGQPISTTGETTVEDSVIINDAEKQELKLFAFQLSTSMCQPNQMQIVKTGDRATAEPGDTSIYRISVRNIADVGLDTLVITDTLPLGFKLLPKSIRGEIDGQVVNITTEKQGSTVVFRTDATLPPGKVLNIAYATQITSDAIRGTGRNSAIVNGKRADNRFAIKDGPATHQLKIREGITSDCGTIIGRVFVDKNFDGEQQPNEPGVPNAVVYMEDGNRITTDPNGLFSVANVLPGNHTGVLDLTSLPGYTLAPNLYFKERNSQSRLVRLEPGGLVRMNFAVTPTFQEEVQK
uniref:DUF11 domain-containing protein n=1 Tax=Calothrix sp. 336/3 TaxID=1337936 RepID=UPI001EE08AD9|nr:hypothetical protein [Calothrix sp. 336/3]